MLRKRWADRGDLNPTAGVGGTGSVVILGRLCGQLQFEFLQQQAELGFGLGIAGEHQLAAVSRRQVHVDHLHRGKLLQDVARGQRRRQRVQAPGQRDVQAIS